MVDGVFPRQDHLRDGQEGISLLQETLDDPRQGLRGMFGGVMEKDDGAGTYLRCNPAANLRGGEILPVQTVNTTNKSIVPFTNLCYTMNDRDIHS